MTHLKYSLVLVAFLGMFAVPASAGAFFTGSAPSAGGAGAGSLNIDVMSEMPTPQSRESDAANTGEIDFTYTIATTATSSSASSFCDSLDVTVERNEAVIYDGNLSGFSASSSPLAAGATDELGYEFASSALSPSGTCAVTFTYEAAQAGQAYGAGFSDREEDSFTLSASDFGGEEPATTSPGVQLNELYADPGDGSDTPDSEFVELFNAGTGDADISGWEIRDNIGERHTFATSTTLAAGTKTVVDFGEILNNTGDQITLFNDSGQEIDRLEYEESDVDEGRSISRCPGYAEAQTDRTPTRGVANDCPTPSENNVANSSFQTQSDRRMLAPQSETTSSGDNPGPSAGEADVAGTSTASTSAATSSTSTDSSEDKKDDRDPADEPREAKEPSGEGATTTSQRTAAGDTKQPKQTEEPKDSEDKQVDQQPAADIDAGDASADTPSKKEEPAPADELENEDEDTNEPTQ